MPRRDADPLDWQAIFDDHRRSGLTQAEFCRRRGISLPAFRKQRYARPAPVPAQRPRFVPVALVADAIAPDGLAAAAGSPSPRASTPRRSSACSTPWRAGRDRPAAAAPRCRAGGTPAH